jgi:glutamate-5-semialdehyde dehydrogenase
MNDLILKIKNVKEASYPLASLTDEIRNLLLKSIADKLRISCQIILEENAKDLALMDKNDPRYDRLLLTENRINSIASDIESVTKLASPLKKILYKKKLDNGLKIQKITVPLGVVAAIYEARPNVTLDIFTLAFKSGNACILKGGKEAHYSNNILVNIIQNQIEEYNLDQNIIFLLPSHQEATHTLLQAQGLVDVCIPRGSQSLINFVRKNATVPVIETGAGIVHTFFDKSGDLQKGIKIINNAKTRRVSVCNALDTLIVHEDRLDDLPALVEPLISNNVEIFSDEKSHRTLEFSYPDQLLNLANQEDYGCEFLAYKLAIKTVTTREEAIEHIKQYSSGHSEAIIAEDKNAITYFIENIDAAAIYINASTAFTDGGEFGMGAEIGVSTQKLHVRGPMGLEALTSYKWVVYGDGHIRN